MEEAEKEDKKLRTKARKRTLVGEIFGHSSTFLAEVLTEDELQQIVDKLDKAKAK